MTSAFYKQENETKDNSLPAFKSDNIDKENKVSVLTKEQIVEKIKEYKQGDDKLIFDNIEAVDYNFIYSKFNRCHFKPRYKNDTKQVFYP